MRHNIIINLHNILKVVIRSDKSSYLKYFSAELPAGFISRDDAAPADIEIIAGDDVPQADAGDIYIEGCFKKIYRYRCLIKGISDKNTRVYFKGPAWGIFLPMDLDAVFFHNQILDPMIYYKMLARKILMVHASAVGDGDKIYLFSGSSGAGKTSLAFRFLNIGYSFLGDDVIFVSLDGVVFSYPKRVHYFSYLKKKNTFLRVPKDKAFLSGLREMVRGVLQVLFKENFYLSTRIRADLLFPSLSYADQGSLDTIFLIRTNGPVSFENVVFSNDARDFLLKVILKGRQDIVKQVQYLENSTVSEILKKARIVSATMEEVKIGKL
jgi:hypothetical protein